MDDEIAEYEGQLKEVREAIGAASGEDLDALREAESELASLIAELRQAAPIQAPKVGRPAKQKPKQEPKQKAPPEQETKTIQETKINESGEHTTNVEHEKKTTNVAKNTNTKAQPKAGQEPKAGPDPKANESITDDQPKSDAFEAGKSNWQSFAKSGRVTKARRRRK